MIVIGDLSRITALQCHLKWGQKLILTFNKTHLDNEVGETVPGRRFTVLPLEEIKCNGPNPCQVEVTANIGRQLITI